jgi:outer membrane receptor protein involved in Fe transport
MRSFGAAIVAVVLLVPAPAGSDPASAVRGRELLEPALEPEQATQWIAGVVHEPMEGVRLQASTYFTDRTDLIA